MAVLPNGSLLVADAGAGASGAQHAGACASGEEGPACTGDTGAVTRIANPGTSSTPGGVTPYTGLLSVANQGSADPTDPPGAAATGLDAVSVAPNGKVFGIFTYIPPKLLNGLPASVKRQDGKLVQLSHGKIHVIANIAAYSLAHPNKHHPKDSDPYGILALNHRIYLTDAANNTLLAVHRGHIKTVRVFPYRHGSGKDGSFDTVPTSLAIDRKGNLYVGTLGSLTPGDGRVYKLSQTGQVLRVVKHLSQVDGVAVAPNGNIFASEIFGGQAGPFDSMGQPNGDLVRISPNGSRHTTAVPLPGGVTFNSGHLYVSEFSVSGTDGSVARLK
jgi:hypothetical protein